MTITYRESIELYCRRLRRLYNMTITYCESIEHRKKKKKKGNLNFQNFKKKFIFYNYFYKKFSK